jgi:hypothetical protein
LITVTTDFYIERKFARRERMAGYHHQKVGDTMFQVLTRYQDLQAIGSGAQGVVM